MPLIDVSLPYVILVTGILLGLRFHRSRLTFAILVLVLADRTMYYFGPIGVMTGEHAQTIFLVTSLLLPINLSLIYFVKDRGLLNLTSLFQLAFIGLQPSIVYLLLRDNAGDFHHLYREFLPIPWQKL